MQTQTQTQQQSLSDKDIVNDILTSTKHVSTIYHQGILEANSPNTRQAFYDLHDHTLECHLNLLETMKNKGWYQPEKASQGQKQNQSNYY
ncbi:spore coat protein [Natranaerobius trueperi]|uniref:Spore coat protein n=1 Tax=Natranaerobius trueperi TaxID=759412 RepID=A0A226BXU1_9FIRM|nr:spore coat protein [Natranaerobius trueperi]OWZ83755.1 hypothetical protein CDO51_06585 [Natranaerobius trueperi]